MARETSAGAVLIRRDGANVLYLLLHYAADHWDFPKGNVEEGEDDHATVRREIKEETGIAAFDFVGTFQETLRYSYKWNGLTVHKVVRMYLAETDQAEVTLSAEHTAFAWLPFAEAEARLTHDKSKSLLRAAREALSQH
jgi:8-oxo-dGTP pyrophosphatase MutT (NUDIX family)